MKATPDPANKDLEATISPEGIFVSCFHGPTRMWEFHPDDVTSLGVYRDDGQMHEVIVTVNRDFDVAESARGFKELNERLSRELKADLTVDAERGSSQLGVVLWPSHLAGNALWEFYFIGEDGLARFVSPGTPNASRNLYKPIRREMTRFAKPRLPTRLPRHLIDRGFAYHGDIGWYQDDAVMAAEWLHRNGAAVIDSELWLVKNAVVQPHIQTAAGVVAYHNWTATQPSETWESFANRSLDITVKFIGQFQWPENTAEPAEREVRFCLTWVWKEWLEEDGFRFPK
jgi:hypothetical protein